MTSTPLFTAIALAAALALGSTPAHGDMISIDLSASTSWRATADASLGQQWAIGNFSASDGVAATAPYGNSVTPLNANRMMWYCGSDGSLCPGGGDGGVGPTEVYFGRSIFIDPGNAFSGAVAVIADDFFDLVINGIEVVASTLDGHKDANGQPVPIVVNLTPFLRHGNNVLALRAMDGYLESAAACAQRGPGFEAVSSNLGDFCKGNRELEYMFMSGSVVVVPEPGALSLVGLALLVLGFMRPRSRSVGH